MNGDARYLTQNRYSIARENSSMRGRDSCSANVTHNFLRSRNNLRSGKVNEISEKFKRSAHDKKELKHNIRSFLACTFLSEK